MSVVMVIITVVVVAVVAAVVIVVVVAVTCVAVVLFLLGDLRTHLRQVLGCEAVSSVTLRARATRNATRRPHAMGERGFRWWRPGNIHLGLCICSFDDTVANLGMLTFAAHLAPLTHHTQPAPNHTHPHPNPQPQAQP
jgi:hypothetical protein